MDHHIKTLNRFGQRCIGEHQFDVDVGMLLLEVTDDRCDVAPPETQRRVDLERTHQTTLARLQILRQRIELPDQLRAALAQQCALLRKAQAARGAVNKPRAQLLFQLLQTLRHRRGRQAQRPRRGNQAAVFLDGQQEAQIGGVGHGCALLAGKAIGGGDELVEDAGFAPCMTRPFDQVEIRVGPRLV